MFILIRDREGKATLVNLDWILAFHHTEGGLNVCFAKTVEGVPPVHFWGMPMDALVEKLREHGCVVDLPTRPPRKGGEHDSRDPTLPSR